MRRRRRYARLEPPPGLWADLGPGDPGYRLRPGRTGFDPFEQTQEYARVFGILLKGVFVGRLGPYPFASLVILFALLSWFVPEAGAVLILLVVLPTRLQNLFLVGGAYIFVALFFWFLIRIAVRRSADRH